MATTQVTVMVNAPVAAPVAQVEQFPSTYTQDGDYKRWSLNRKCVFPCGCEEMTWSLHQKRPLLKIRYVSAWCCLCKGEKFQDTPFQSSIVNYVNTQNLTHVSATSTDTKAQGCIKAGFFLAIFSLGIFLPISICLWVLGCCCCGKGGLNISPWEGLNAFGAYNTGKGLGARKLATEISKTVVRDHFKFDHDLLDKHADHQFQI